MPRKLDPKIAEVLQRYEFGPNACWDSHGVWVIYHKVLEQIAAKSGIQWETPNVLLAERESVAVLVGGKLGKNYEWSIGEAAIGLNYKVTGNQQGYPFAMAEKRGKDRVILKLIGLHGLAYSEEEADDFKDAKPNQRQTLGPLNSTDLRKSVAQFGAELQDCEDSAQLEAFLTAKPTVALLQQIKQDKPDWWYDSEDRTGIGERIEGKRRELQAREAG